MLFHVNPCTYSEQLWCKIVYPFNIFKKTRTHWMYLRPQKTKSEADPETSLKNNNNAPKCSFPSLADTTDRRPELGTSTPRIVINLIYKTKKTKGNVCLLLVECIVSCGELTTNYSLVEKLYCMTGKWLHSNSLQKQSRLRAEAIFHW